MAPLPCSETWALLPHILNYRPPLSVFAPPQPVPLFRHALPHTPSFQLAQAIFEPNLYLYQYPSNLIPVILPAYTTYEDGTHRVF